LAHTNLQAPVLPLLPQRLNCSRPSLSTTIRNHHHRYTLTHTCLFLRSWCVHLFPHFSLLERSSSSSTPALRSSSFRTPCGSVLFTHSSLRSCRSPCHHIWQKVLRRPPPMVMPTQQAQDINTEPTLHCCAGTTAPFELGNTIESQPMQHSSLNVKGRNVCLLTRCTVRLQNISLQYYTSQSSGLPGVKVHHSQTLPLALAYSTVVSLIHRPYA